MMSRNGDWEGLEGVMWTVLGWFGLGVRSCPMAFGWCGLASTSCGRPGLFGGVGVVVVLSRVRVTAFGGCRGRCVPSSARGVLRSCTGYHGCVCGGSGGYWCCMVPSERGEVGV